MCGSGTESKDTGQHAAGICKFRVRHNNDAQRYLLQIVFILAVCAAIVLWEGRRDIPPVFFGMVFYGFVAAGIVRFL